MRGILVAAAVVGTLAWAGAASATVVHVNCAHANLQNKINHAAPGSTLKIKGRCVGSFTVSNREQGSAWREAPAGQPLRHRWFRRDLHQLC